MSKAYKGSDFERVLCKQLSKWWSGAEARDDIFWRSSQSGGRATQRLKSGKKTYGSYGDIAAVDPIGEPLLKLFTIELKRGSSYGTPGDLFDTRPTECQRPFEACIEQAIRSHKDAGSKGWLLISRRDSRIPIAYFDPAPLMILSDFKNILLTPPSVTFRILINKEDGFRQKVRFVGLPLDVFLQRVSPAQIIQCLKGYEEN